MNSELHSLRLLLQQTLAAAGDQSPVLRRCLSLAVLTASLRGIAYAAFIPLFLAFYDEQSLYFFSILAAVTLIFIAASVSDWFSRDYDYKGHAAQASDQLRRQLGESLRQIPLQELYKKRSGELNAAIAGDVDDVVNYSMTVALMLINAVVTPATTGMVALLFDWRLGLALLLIFPATLPLYLVIKPLLMSNKKELADANATLTAETLEYVQGMPVLKSTNCVGTRSVRFNKAVDAVQQIQRDAMRSEAPLNILLASVVEIGLMLIVGLGLWFVVQGNLQVMVLAGLLVAIIRFAEPLSVFISMMSIFEMVRHGYRRLQLLQDINPLEQKLPILSPQQFNIRFENVSFRYDDQHTDALHQINANIPARALTALVGSSGCGKTTLIRLLMRYADPQTGKISIDQCDIRQIETEKLNQMISVVFQDVYLFDDTIMANIRMGRADATDDEVISAAKAACCHDFIVHLQDGYQTCVGDIGGNLSGGEKQRISIARALLKDAPIVILDEPTAALDTHSELAVQQAINALIKDKTVIVIAHRLSTIVAANTILVLDNGTIVERGNHQQLLQQNGRYAQLWNAQHTLNSANDCP